MGSDHKVQVDMEGGSSAPAEVTVVREAPLTATRWRVGGALLAMALCVSAALFFTWNHQKQDRVEEADDLRHTLRQVSTSGGIKAAIHLEGRKEKNPVNPYDVAVQWTDSEDQAFVHGDLKLENNEIVIPKNGLYFVYSQVSFRVNCRVVQKVQGSRKMVTLSQTVMRHSRSIGEDGATLLHSIHTECEGLARSVNGGISYNSVYAGAVFRLRRDDRLNTEVNATFLNDSAGENFFGVFAL